LTVTDYKIYSGLTEKLLNVCSHRTCCVMRGAVQRRRTAMHPV